MPTLGTTQQLRVILVVPTGHVVAPNLVESEAGSAFGPVRDESQVRVPVGCQSVDPFCTIFN